MCRAALYGGQKRPLWEYHRPINIYGVLDLRGAWCMPGVAPGCCWCGGLSGGLQGPSCCEEPFRKQTRPASFLCRQKPRGGGGTHQPLHRGRRRLRTATHQRSRPRQSGPGRAARSKARQGLEPNGQLRSPLLSRQEGWRTTDGAATTRAAAAEQLTGCLRASRPPCA